MKSLLKEKVKNALVGIAAEDGLDVEINEAAFVIEEPRDSSHGHLATNAALTLSKILKQKPRDLAARIMAGLDNREGYVEHMETAGPGFINFTLSLTWWTKVLAELLEKGPDYGRGRANGQKVQVEYVSANPTGPLHVGHGRGAAIGDALARVMEFAGYEVSREYYINDAGRQMNILGASVLARMKELSGDQSPFPEDHYRGEYIIDLAREYLAKNPEALKGDQEKLTAELTRFAKDRILAGIKADLAAFRVRHDVWFSETSLYDEGLVPQALDFLKKNGHLYEEAGALWFRSEPLGDDKNRVLIKSSGDMTYFAADIAYHWNKFERGFDEVIDIWGADHHGYIPRMKAAVEALGYRREQLSILLVQFVNLLRDGEPLAMSTRGGTFVTLREVVDEVGADAARFIFLTRSSDSGLDFDLALATSQTKDNPVYYVQYVGARIESILASLGDLPPTELALLTQPEELALMKHLSSFPEITAAAAAKHEPHHVATWLTSLAKLFHHYYGQHRINVEEPGLKAARAALIKGIRLLIRSGLDLLGVSSPNKM